MASPVSAFATDPRALLRRLQQQTQISRYALRLREGTQRSFLRFVTRPNAGGTGGFRLTR